MEAKRGEVAAHQAAGTVVHLEMCGDYDIANKDSLSAMLLRGENADAVVIDMTETAYIDSSALHCLVHLKTQLLAKGGVVRLVGVDSNICRVFAVTGLDELFEINGRTGGR